MRSLCGGERNRLLLARLFARPANVLVLDEPTNDLDIDTLELLEDLLQNYDGTVFLVSHDRTFLDNVVTSTIAFEGDGRWREYEGGVQDWLIQSRRAREIAAAQAPAPADGRAGKRTPAPSSQRRASTCRRASRTAQEAQLQGAARTRGAARADRGAGGRSRSASPRCSSRRRRDLRHAMPARAAQLGERHARIDDELLAALERWEALGALRCSACPAAAGAHG